MPIDHAAPATQKVRAALLKAVNSGQWSRRSLSLAAGLGETAVRDIIRRPEAGVTLATAEALAKALGGTVESVFSQGVCPRCDSAQCFDNRFCMSCGHGVGLEPRHQKTAERERMADAAPMMLAALNLIALGDGEAAEIAKITLAAIVAREARAIVNRAEATNNG